MNIKIVEQKLKKAGVSEAVIADALGLQKKKVVLPNLVVTRIQDMLTLRDRVVVVQKRGKFRVYSLEGYKATVASTKKHRFWMKTGQNKKMAEAANQERDPKTVGVQPGAAA